jgi:tetratricopeptide (TPR) repeat protein
VSLDLSFPDLRHPWLDALVEAPEQQVSALLRGAADIPPYTRGEPSDAAASLLFGLPAEDPAVRAFDAGCLALLERLSRDIPAASAARWPMRLLLLDTLFGVILRLRPPRTVAALHDGYARWFNLVETAVVDAALDLRRGFWRVLTVTQDMSPRGPQSRHLMPLWLEICGEAGPRGRYPASYLDVGLLGLRRLPLPDDQDANEEAVCHGLARWAAQQAPSRAAFDARLREIEAAYPHHAQFWPPLVERVLFVAEEHLAERNNRTPSTFPAAAWWREAMELPVPRAGQRASPPSGRASVEPPAPTMREAILRDISQPIAALKPRIAALMAGHRRYAEATGDAFYLVRTACNVGMQLLRKGTEPARGGVAAELARLALRHEPTHVYAWALWRDAAATGGATAAAETIGWEAIRRFPENPQWWNQLATLLADRRGRPEEAVALLQQALDRFPLNVAVRPQLARLFSDRFDRLDEARALLEAAIATLPDNPFSYGDLAALLADRLRDPEGAAALLRRELDRFPGDEVATNMLASLRAGRRLRRVAKVAPIPAAEDLADPGDLPFAAPEARRALFRAELRGDTAMRAEAERLLAQAPDLTYARWVAARLGLGETQARQDTAFAFAFARAAREGSPGAFQALTRDYIQGLDGFVARAGLTLVTTGSDFALPPTANDPAAGPRLRRFADLVGTMRAALPHLGGERRRLMPLLVDFAGSELSLAA